MRPDVSQAPYLDVIWMGCNMPTSLLPVSRIDLHLYSYLACIISLLGRNPINSWNYRYKINNEGFPFSADLEVALSAAIKSGFFKEIDSGKLVVNKSKITEEFNVLSYIHRPQESRTGYLKSALRVALMLPTGQIRGSISYTSKEKEIYRKLQHARFVFEEQEEIDDIYNEYTTVLEAFEDNVGELSPLIVWISSRLVSMREELN